MVAIERRRNNVERPVSRRTILLFDLPLIVGDLVEGLLNDDEVKFVRAEGDFLDAVSRLCPDVAVVQPDRAEASSRAFLEDPLHVRVLVLAADERRAALYDVAPSGAASVEMTPRALRGALEIDRP